MGPAMSMPRCTYDPANGQVDPCLIVAACSRAPSAIVRQSCGGGAALYAPAGLMDDPSSASVCQSGSEIVSESRLWRSRADMSQPFTFPQLPFATFG